MHEVTKSLWKNIVSHAKQWVKIATFTSIENFSRVRECCIFCSGAEFRISVDIDGARPS